uniref:Uncharacterized protein TCIL3000_7_4630 n=1 Tax=Trypanosoma congolense (strain IL3000) TaxID=1068625 RepID=G0UQI8_TRYCI|nr:unnamed protein product [Trypanosoma congolense IL3000]
MQPRAVDATGSGQPNGRMQVGESNENVVDTLRRRYVQAELQLRECEDRFRRDCARQEQELELIQMENNKLKQKIEEIRMAESSVDRSVPTQLCASVGDIGDGDSKLLKASSQKYRWAREAVDKARGDLVEYESRLAAARERCKELRNKHGSMSMRPMHLRNTPTEFVVVRSYKLRLPELNFVDSSCTSPQRRSGCPIS